MEIFLFDLLEAEFRDLESVLIFVNKCLIVGETSQGCLEVRPHRGPARNVSTKTADKHHKTFSKGHQVVTGKGQPRTQSAPHTMVEPEKPSPGY
jgi:hypothetical protein